MEWPGGSEKNLQFHYIFKMSDGMSKSFQIILDSRTLNCLNPGVRTPPEWTRLGYFKCKNCPLPPSSNEHCPVAVNLAGLVDEFRDFSSYENSYVLVMTRERDISKNTTVQEGLSSIMGLYMVTSGCPIMAGLKPMVRYHLPFATIKENVYRTISMYLLIQYFLKKKGKTPDWDLKKLEEIYDEIRAVNAGMAMRLKEASIKDASVTALASLDYLASLLPLIINETIQDIEDSFAPYMNQ